MTAKEIAALLAEHAVDAYDFTIGDVVRVLMQSERAPLPTCAVQRAALLLGLKPDCGAHGCVTTSNRGGMRTNGGCRCLVNGRDGRLLHPRERAALRAALEVATKVLTDAA